MSVTVTLDDAQAQALFARLTALVANPRSALVQSGQVLQRLVRDTFTRTTDPWGRRWQRHAASTIKARDRLGGSGQILMGQPPRMFNSIDYQADASSVSVIAGGAQAPYAEYHQFGNPNHRAWGGPVRPLAQRAFLPVRAPGVPDIPAPWWFEILLPVESAMAKAAKA